MLCARSFPRGRGKQHPRAGALPILVRNSAVQSPSFLSGRVPKTILVTLGTLSCSKQTEGKTEHRMKSIFSQQLGARGAVALFVTAGLLVVAPAFAQGVMFTAQPTNQNVLPGANVTLAATATGTGPVHYQWQFEGTNLPNATNASYSFINASLSNHGNYSVVAIDSLSTNVSSNAFIYVLVRPVFVQQPEPLTVLQGQTATFSVIVTGAPPIWYFWLQGPSYSLTSSVPVLVLTNVQISASIRAYATNLVTGAGGLRSATVQLTVLPDHDRDGIADSWEAQYGMNTNNAADALLDLDGDGMINRDEYVAGTHPTNALSVLKLTLTTTNTGVLQFVAQTNVGYTVQYRTNLGSAVWNNVTSISSDSLVRTVRVNAPNPPPEKERYYRIVTPPVP